MTTRPIGAADHLLVPLLVAYLPQQRWFSAKGQQLDTRAVDINARTVIAHDFSGVDVEQLLFTVRTDGRLLRYQMWVGWTDQLPDQLRYAAIGTVEGRTAFDALADTRVSTLLLQIIGEDRELGNGVAGRREPDADFDTTAIGRVIGAEQSNTSLIYGQFGILKMFRGIEPGPNPDAEIHRALHAVGSRHIAAPLGEIVGPVDGQETTLGLLTEFFANSAEGWAMATSSVRDLMSEGDLRADEVGGDFAAEAERLGEAVAAVHRDLATAFGTQDAPQEELGRILDRMRADANAAADLVPSLAEHRDGIMAAFGRAADHADGITLQRIHGDLHLGQVLRTLHGWSLIDFEGEPAKPLEYRRALHSPLKDIAGMLRSFDYAARGLVVNPHSDAQHKYRASEWAERNRKAFCDGYAAAAGSDPRQAGNLLRAFELDKAIYEVVYEHGHRPLWESIPLHAVVALINTGGSS